MNYRQTFRTDDARRSFTKDIETRAFRMDTDRRNLSGGGMISKKELTKGDLQPFYFVAVKDSNDDPVDITGATIYCTMRAEDGTKKINRQTTGITITDGAKGEFQYEWQSGDTDTVGQYDIKFEIDPAAADIFTIPAAGKERAQVVINESLDA